jgi:hypothetical protein
MVRALLEGTKTQTRRIFKLPTKGIYERKDMGGWAPTINGGGGTFTFGRDGKRLPVPETIGIWHQTTGRCLDAPFQIGDRLWVREGVALVGSVDPPFVLYRANGYDAECRRHHFDPRTIPPEEEVRWHPSIHMPRWASRLTLTVTDVRVEQLQDIGAADAIAEGIERTPHGNGDQWLSYPAGSSAAGWLDPRESYRTLWEAINGAGSWDTNPWVVALTFTVERVRA